MKYLDLSLDTPAENLALDEAMLESVDQPTVESPVVERPTNSRPEQPSLPATGYPQSALRFWRASKPCVILGRSSRVGSEVHGGEAQQLGVPILRRFSGGASVVIGPGCLMYSLLIHLEASPRLRMLDVAHRYVMERMLAAIQELVPAAELDGTCDLVLDGRKFSGNSLRVGRNWMLYHGTFLLDMRLSWMDELLKHPPREPEYRRGRSHSDFVTNLRVDEESLIRAIRQAWEADEEFANPPLDSIPRLIETRYGRDEWNHLVV